MWLFQMSKSLLDVLKSSWDIQDYTKQLPLEENSHCDAHSSIQLLCLESALHTGEDAGVEFMHILVD